MKNPTMSRSRSSLGPDNSGRDTGRPLHMSWPVTLLLSGLVFIAIIGLRNSGAMSEPAPSAAELARMDYEARRAAARAAHADDIREDAGTTAEVQPPIDLATGFPVGQSAPRFQVEIVIADPDSSSRSSGHRHSHYRSHREHTGEAREHHSRHSHRHSADDHRPHHRSHRHHDER